MSQNNASRRTHQKVWRDSLGLGECESEVFRPYSRDEMALAIEGAERFDRHLKQPGARNGPIGHVGLEVYRALWRRANFRSGQCDPSIARIMRDTGRSRRAVVEALKRLWTFGFVRWIRRLVETGERGFRGPQVQQATNAYELRVLGAAVLDLLPTAKRARYRPKFRPAAPTPRAPRQRGKKTPAERVWAAWGRMGERIRTSLLEKLDRAAERRKAKDTRESTEADQTMPSGYIPSS